MDRTHSSAVLVALSGLDEDRRKLGAMTFDMWEAEGGGMYVLDFFANGAVHRTMALLSGFQSMVRDFNFVCAGALVRMQIDTALRFHAVYLAPQAHDFAEAVARGEEVRKLKDRSGERMTDAHLVRSLSVDYPWVERIYKQASGYVHLSDTHIYSTCSNVNRAEHRMQIRVTGVDEGLPDPVYLDTIATFRAAVEILIDHLHGWIELKRRPNSTKLSLTEPPGGDFSLCCAYLDIGR